MSTKFIIDNKNSSLSGQSIVGNLSATTFYGDGSNLTGINYPSRDAVNILYSDLYNKIISSGLTAGTTYRLTDYKSVNYIHGWDAMNQEEVPQVQYAGLIDGSFQTDNGFNSYVTTMDYQRSNSYYFDGLKSSSQVVVDNGGQFVVGTNDFTFEWYQYLEDGPSNYPRSFSIGTSPSTQLSFYYNKSTLLASVYYPANGNYLFPANESEMDFMFANSPLIDTYISNNLNYVSYSNHIGDPVTDYCMQIDGNITVPTDDIYYFGLDSDDGSDAFINNIKVADWYGAHGDNGGVPSGNFYPIFLSAGTHSIKVRLQQRSGGDTVALFFGYDGLTWNVIPSSWFETHNYILNWSGTTYPIQLEESPVNNWKHIALERQSGIVKVFENGKKIFQENLNNDLQSTEVLSIGNETIPNGDAVFRGYLTNFRYVSGTSVYNSDFTPSTKPLYATDETILLLSITDQNHMIQNNVYGQNLLLDFGNVSFDTKVPFTDYDVFAGGNFTTYNNYGSRYLVKLKADGSVDESFYIGGKDYGFDGEVSVVKLLADGKVLVGGYFYNYSGSSNQFLVKLNTDGTLDPNFSTTTIPNYVDGYVRDIYIEDKTGNIFIGGSFLTINNLQRQRLAKLDKNGYLIDAFEANINGDVFSIEMIDNNLYVGGNFSIVQGNGTNCIVQLNSTTGVVDNVCEGVGFNDTVRKIKRNNVGTLICVGSFIDYAGFGANYIINLNTDLTILDLYNGTNNFDDTCYTLDIDYLGNMYVGGDFLNYNSNAATRVAKLDISGNTDLNFNCQANNSVYHLSLTMQKRLFLGGEFNSINGTNSNSIVRVMADNSSPLYNSSEVFISDEEVLYLKAISNNQIERICYSEKYPNDIIEYSPYTNVLGRSQQYYNGTTLYDGTQVSGFDLKWDSGSSQVYFYMPASNPIYFGHFMYFYAEFYNGDFSYYCSFSAEPVEPGFRVPQYNNTDGDSDIVSTNLIVSSGGTKVILTDLTYNDILNYQADTLYVETISKTVDCYGYITKRIDTDRNISAPFDFKNIKYRRYEMNLNSANSNFGTDYYAVKDLLNFYFGGPNYFTIETTGKYKDFYSFDTFYNGYEVSERNIILEGPGGPDGGYWFAGSYDNNVFMSVNYNNHIKGPFLRNNTFIYGCYNNYLQGYIYNNIIGEEFYSNQIFGLANFYDNLLGYAFNYNSISNCYFNNNRTVFDFGSNIINNSFGYNSIASYFSRNRINYQFNGNTIGTYFRNNEINGTFYNNTTLYNFEFNKVLAATMNNCSINSLYQSSINANISSFITTQPIFNLTVNSETTGVNFSSANYIYGDYPKEIVKSTNTSLYIGFLSGASKVYITPVTS